MSESLRRRFAALLALVGAAVVTLLVSPSVRAQLVDDVDYRREGADAVLQVRFATEVQFERAAITRSNEFTQVFYRVVSNMQELSLRPTQRRLPAKPGEAGRPGLPSILLTDEEAGTGAIRQRRLVLRFDSPVEHRVRAGRGNQTIEIVFEGLGSAVAARKPATEPQGRYRVTLQSSTDAGAFLEAPIPAALQDASVFTTQRMVDGKALHEVHLGPFSTRAEAEVALTQLKARFPQAAITETPAPAALAAAAAPPAPATAPAAAAPTPPAPSEPVVAAAVPSSSASAPASQEAAAPVTADIDAEAARLLAQGRDALARQDAAAAVEALSRLLDLPPNPSSREAQALIGDARIAAGDSTRARSEYEVFLRLYPTGADADRVRSALSALPAAALPGSAQVRVVTPTTTLTGSASSFYYGGQSKVRTQEFQDSPLGGLPTLLSDASLSAADQSQLVTSVDMNWRYRDADVDRRIVLRDQYTKDFQRSDRSYNRLSALYFDQRSLTNGTSFRLGRQSPVGNGVLGRFDGAQAAYAFRPRWKAGVVAGVPTDNLLDANRYFYGAWVEAEALTPQFGGSLYAIQQTVDSQVDRRAIGSEMRYFDTGLSATAQLDYDLVLKGLNIASIQANWQREDNTVFNVLYDRRTAPMLMLGNALFFGDPNTVVRATRITDLLGSKTLQALREQVVATTAVSTQAAVGVMTPLTPRWQIGGDIRYTNTGAIQPVPDILPSGLPSTGDIWSIGGQLIGTNLYSSSDTHVVIVNLITGPAFNGQLLSYNNSSLVAGVWQLEPSLKLYMQSDDTGTNATRWTPGMRVTYRFGEHVAAESELSVEQSKVTGPLRSESSTRVYYYLGGRYDF